MTKLHGYDAALMSAAYFYQKDAGFLHLSGADRIDFLQRQTTNDLRQLTADRPVSTVLTSPTARILDVFLVIDDGDLLDILTLPGRFAETTKFLRSRIFFSDQVYLDDLSTKFSQILLLGPQAEDQLKGMGLQSPKINCARTGHLANQPIIIVAQKILSKNTYRLIMPYTSVEDILTVLDGGGVKKLNPETFEILRVEAGQPGPVGELVEAYTPLEVGLQDLISDSKGCYTGQEVIARQITYDKVTKNLVGIRLSTSVDIGAKIKVDGKSAGKLTSIVESPRFGWIGLGLVRRQYRGIGIGVSIQSNDGLVTDGEFVELPFR